MTLSDKDQNHFYNLKKGFEGEVMFDLLTETLECDCFILNDLLLQMNNTTFQIDSLIITADILYLFEVKNFEGDFYYEKEQLFMKNKFEVTNPLVQLRRNESLMRQLLQSNGYNLPVVASVVFINPEFTLYQAPLNLPFLFPTQVIRYLNQLNRKSIKINNKQRILADKLASLHLDESPFTQLPSYDYDQLQKGIVCIKCNSFLLSIKGMRICCKECGHTEVVSTSILRSVEEFRLLFPNEKITTGKIYEWCKIIDSKKRIQRVLEQHYKLVGVHQWSYYQ
ncbi:nuclease-related domain-containing protein [Bacillus sp. FJAT-49736]|uniref:nuclease-related domain-containing protein n=1 Tax=Bacillus sp. FJAT-49736 TaxID=2833582 RepID=UPI001BC9A383|nr:nuclease-related domain-containing protein [Bacillus sp. FJAT-49736]MBS4174502.1 NERD domain-containing protein [Bacillus sp. FJAT-49736]